MVQFISQEIRVRVVEAVVTGGMSHRASARRFGVSPPSAVRWVREYRRTGHTLPRPCGGDRRSGRIEAQREALFGMVQEEPDLTMRQIRTRVYRKTGEMFSLSALTRFFQRHRLECGKRRSAAHGEERPR